MESTVATRITAVMRTGAMPCMGVLRCTAVALLTTVALLMAIVATMGVAAPHVTRAGVTPTRSGHAPTICHGASDGGDLLHSARCSADTLVFRLGYEPELARLPGGRPVHVEADGSCSWVPDRPFGFDFSTACRMHDLGYDLIRVRWVDAAAKPRIDDALRDGMLDACTHEQGLRRLLCRAMAQAAWLATSLAPTPDRPDPGSFTRPA